MNIRKSVATALRSFEAYDVAARIERRLYTLEVAAFRLAQRLDPIETTEWTGEGWEDLGWVSSADAFEEYMAPLRERAAESSKVWAAALEPLFESIDAGPIWRDPTPKSAALAEETIAKISESMKHPVVAAFEPLDIRYPVDFKVPTPFVDFAFHETDVRPYMDEINAHVKELARQQHEVHEQRMADWLDDVGAVVPEFGADAARQIIAEREHPLEGGEIGRAAE